MKVAFAVSSAKQASPAAIAAGMGNPIAAGMFEQWGVCEQTSVMVLGGWAADAAAAFVGHSIMPGHFYEERSTDTDIDKCRKRYAIFKTHYAGEVCC